MVKKLLALAACLATSAAGCGGVECGTGTKEQSGQCVPDTLAVCAEGTTWVDGACKPAGDKVCAPGTSWVGGKCVGLTCAAGTEEKDGKCVILDPLTRVTVPESAEPNDALPGAKRFTLPAVGAAAAVLGGTIDAPSNDQVDADLFVFAGEAGQRLKVKAQPVGAPEIIVVVAPADHPETLPRLVLSLSTRQPERDLVIPGKGDWTVQVAELANYEGGLARGGAAFTYTVDVSQLPELPATALVDNAGSGSFEQTGLFSVPGTAGGSLLKLTFDEAPAGQELEGLRAVWAYDAQGNMVFAQTDYTSSGSIVRMSEPLYVPVPASGVKLGVDYVYARGSLSMPYSFRLEAATVEEVSTLPFSKDGTLDDGIAVFALTVPDNSVLSVRVDDLGSSVRGLLEIHDASFRTAGSAEIPWYDTPTTVRAYAPAGGGGRWFVLLRNISTSGGTSLEYSLSVEGADVHSLGALAVPGTASATASATADVPLWFSATLPSMAELSLKATPISGMQADVEAFDQTLALLAEQEGSASTPTLVRGLVGVTGVVLVAVTTDIGGDVLMEMESRGVTVMTETENNGTTDTANEVTLSAEQSVAITGTLPVRDDVDWFELVIPGSENVSLVAQTGPGPRHEFPDTMLTLYEADGDTEVPGGENDDIDYWNDNYWSRFELNSIPPGTYYLRNKLASSDYGEYRLVLTIGPAQ